MLHCTERRVVTKKPIPLILNVPLRL